MWCSFLDNWWKEAVEWRSPHTFIMDGDIKKAYDFTSHKAFAEAARSKGMDEVLILAWLREWRRMRSICRLDAETTSGEVKRTRSLPLGDPAAPMLFNLILDTLATGVEALTDLNKHSAWVNHIVFAGNYWLVATSAKLLKQMTEKWLDLMAEYGWETPVADLAWCSTVKDNEITQFKIRGEKALRTAAAFGFKVLGTMLTFDNKFDVDIKYRLSRANNAFYVN